MAVVESLTKTVGGHSALLDHFGDMVGVFRFFGIYALWGKWHLNQPGVIMAVVHSLTKPVGGLSALLDHFGHMVGVFPIDSTQLVSWLPAVCSEAKSTRVICMENFFLFQTLAFHGILSISIF